jgi:hypothetical protein
MEVYMIANQVLVSSKPTVFSLLICCLVIVVVGLGNVIGQETKSVKKSVGSDVAFSTYTEIPGATEPCNQTECEWWNRLRQAGNDLQRKGSDKSKRKFILLFVEGMEKGYRIPFADRPSQLLVPTIPGQTPRGITPRNGKVELSVEVRADGSVGEINVVRGLRSDMDQLCIRAHRQNIYLPAVKNYTFVTEWQNATCSFWSRKGI